MNMGHQSRKPVDNWTNLPKCTGDESATSSTVHLKKDSITTLLLTYLFNELDEALWVLRGDANMRGSGGKVSSL
jgi:hypothetical protein